jgi:hypothetical protein
VHTPAQYAAHDLDTVYLDGQLVLMVWDTDAQASSYIEELVKRLHAEAKHPSLPWSLALYHKVRTAKNHHTYVVGTKVVDYRWYDTPEVL